MLQNENAMMTIQNANFIELQRQCHRLELENSDLRETIERSLDWQKLYIDTITQLQLEKHTNKALVEKLNMLKPNVAIRGE